ncbi:polysaccharide export protein [Apiospora phragmitis]|uniref:Polysaccharide export protein n=1 Tax=Apiospora phragmitis TaxID=2905665 RepID=A0ABR1TUN1_9PEZI
MIVTYRRFRRTYLRRILYVLVFFFLVDAIHLINSRPDTQRSTLKPRAAVHQSANNSVFLVSVHRNTEKIQREAWNEAVLGLVDYLGAPNVHFSAEGLDARGVTNDISLGMTVWEQLDEIDARPDPTAPREPGWIWNAPEDQFELRRIPYLSRVRNQAMAPLKQLEEQGRRFDKVLWLNDVVFDTQDIVTLFETRDGDYAAVCSMDFKAPPLYYDTFALRDDMGLKTGSLYWPWFQSPVSKDAALHNEPIPVVSCWNGIVVFDSAPYYANPPLQFRGIDDSLADLHLEGSECCLIHADNYLSSQKGVWLNPNVRVGYNVKAYNKIKKAYFPGAFWTVVGAWANRIGQPPRYEPGEACLINEMQIMWSNGWKHL